MKNLGNTSAAVIDAKQVTRKYKLNQKKKEAFNRSPLKSLENFPPKLQNSCTITSHKKWNKHHHEARCTAFKYKTSLKVWPLQEMAFQHLDKLLDNEKCSSSDKQSYNHEHEPNWLLWSMEPKIFALEEPTSGKRRYLTTHLGRFLQHYWRDCNSRHYYELIREGTPCRLYFDLEFCKAVNRHIDSNKTETLLIEFILELIAELSNIFNISISEKDIIDLDSSTKEKFSRHLIVHLPKGKLFADAVECGAFVKAFVGRLAEEVATGELSVRSPVLAECFFVYSQAAGKSTVSHSKEDVEEIPDHSESKIAVPSLNQTCFVDTGVYTRNRIFRLFGSVKYGKPVSASLRVSGTNQFPFRGKLKDINFFFPDTVQNTASLINVEMMARTLVDSFVVPISKYSMEKLVLPKISLKNHQQSNITSSLIIEKASIPQHNKKFTFQQSNSMKKPSPFPALDNFVANVLGERQGVHGSIRAWSIDFDVPIASDLSKSILKYQMKGNRWCENINRAHKSNNIIWVVSIRSMRYWQECHDPECRLMSFRGQVHDVPFHVKKSINEVLLEEIIEGDDGFEKALMRLNLNDVDEKVDENKSSLNDSCDYCGERKESCIPRHLNLKELRPEKVEDDNYFPKKKDNQDSRDDSFTVVTETEESFDKAFGDALFEVLSSNPNIFP